MQVAAVRRAVDGALGAVLAVVAAALKDASAQVQCVMYRLRNQHLSFPLKDGMSVEVRATATLYEPRGEFQLNVDGQQVTYMVVKIDAP